MNTNLADTIASYLPTTARQFWQSVYICSARHIKDILRKLNINKWLGPNCVVDVHLVRTVRDWKTWLGGLKITPAGALLRDDTGVHTFLFMRRRGCSCRTAAADAAAAATVTDTMATATTFALRKINRQT